MSHQSKCGYRAKKRNCEGLPTGGVVDVDRHLEKLFRGEVEGVDKDRFRQLKRKRGDFNRMRRSP